MAVDAPRDGAHTGQEFERVVEAALKVDPAGVSGKNVADSTESSRRGAEVNEVLRSRGLSQAQANAWWNKPNAALDGKTPIQVWLREAEFDPKAFALVKAAAVLA